MTTNESVLISALTDPRRYDEFKWVSKLSAFHSSQDISEPFRFRLASVAGVADRSAGDELVASISLYYLGEEVGVPIVTGPSHPTSTQSSSSSSSKSSVVYELDEWICFPFRISDISLDMIVCVTILGYGGRIVGGTSFYPFSSRGELKTGLKRYCLFTGVAADGSEHSTTLGHMPLSDSERLWRDKRNGRIADVHWLDALTSTTVTTTSSATQPPRPQIDPRDEAANAAGPFITVEFPLVTNHSAIFFTSIPANYDKNAFQYDQMPSPSIPFYDMDLHVENLAEQKASVLSKSLYLVADVDAQPGPRERKLIREILRRPPISLDPAKPADEASLLWKYRYFLRHDVDGFIPFMQCVDWSARVEVAEAEKLVPLWKAIAVEDALMCLSYLFASTHCIRKYAVDIVRRESPQRIRSFLLQLVQGIRYDVERELADFVLELCYNSWEMCSDAYWFASVEAELEGPRSRSASASPAMASNLPPPRAKAAIYTDFLAQLMEGLRKHNPGYADRIDKQVQLRQMLVTLFTTILKDPRDRGKKMLYAKDLIREEKCGIRELFAHQANVHLPSHPSQAARGISHEAFYMFKSAKMPIAVTFAMDMPSSPLGAAVDPSNSGSLLGPRTSPAGQSPTSASALGPRTFNQSPTAGAGAGVTNAAVETDASADDDTSSPPLARNDTALPTTDGNESFSGPAPAPEYSIQDEGPPASAVGVSLVSGAGPVVATPPTPTTRHAAAAAATTGNMTSLDVIFKCGDDTRQDQLVIQVIHVMDAMLKQNGLDLCLTPYTVLATSVNDGFVEKVPNVETLQTVQRDMGGVVRYLQLKNPTPADAHKRAIERFVKSCAGYCVITFLLGIGDRHLENLLLTTDGRLLHIDFGFIFGNDPKPFPPPMKINKEMVDAFGGVQSEGYASFKKYCCSAYNIIRKHAKLILSLLLLMVDASIPQIWDGKLDRRVNILKVQEKLRLELSDAEATQYIQNVIADSVGSVFTNLWDVIHVAAQAARH